MKGRAEKFLDFTSRSGIILSGSKGMISAFYSTPGGYEKIYSQILFRAGETKFRDLQGKTRVRLRLCASFFPLLRPFGAHILKRAQNSPFSFRRPRGARGKSKKRGFCFFSNFLFTLFSRKGAAKSRELKTTPRARGEAADRRVFLCGARRRTPEPVSVLLVAKRSTRMAAPPLPEKFFDTFREVLTLHAVCSGRRNNFCNRMKLYPKRD